MTRLPTVAVGSVTPDGLADAVVITLKSLVNAPCPCALVPAVTVTDAETVAADRAGVVSVGEVPKTKAPDPVSSVTAVARLALLGVAKKADTPEPSPDTPVEIGSPVQLVRVPLAGVPNVGVTNVGDVANTKAPDPVSSLITPANCDEVVAAN